MNDLVEIVEVIHSKSNEELGRYIKDDMLTDENFGLSLVQARFLLVVANRLESCHCQVAEPAPDGPRDPHEEIYLNYDSPRN